MTYIMRQAICQRKNQVIMSQLDKRNRKFLVKIIYKNYLLSFIIPRISISSSDNVNPLRCIILLAYSVALLNLNDSKPLLPPQENEGMNLDGKSAPNTLHETPTTVAVLNIVFIPHLEWSPIQSPINCKLVCTSLFSS